ncbi:serine/threonine-protein phosphatase [Streptomyces olivaceus]|nr:serine/threonine-protein phosphatase [Streptomyces olivaceus]MBZ6127023.1 serine/threonine-protein phosphatase [Streptomyces olivaceus]MBZ6147918.1 serine/threonine-protein phosphatase [Streptomyces olivaceus]MBZ6161475.1 serine/threonine-protein phosphatase [Streptomyces olivaceus]MBZ6189496.1 serine/threonine-protein phosphatase [Streptomyces olivaceus]
MSSLKRVAGTTSPVSVAQAPCPVVALDRPDRWPNSIRRRAACCPTPGSASSSSPPDGSRQHIAHRGAACLLYTDGVVEARGGGPLGNGMFGEERLRRAAAERAGMPTEAVVEQVQMLVAEWIGDGRHDDIAVVAITAPLGAMEATPAGRDCP